MHQDAIHHGAPLFRRIAGALTDAIAHGDYPVGEQLPPEFTLARMFGASRFTIREALAELRSSGLIASRGGSGSVVLRTAPREPVFAEGYSSIEDFLAGATEAPIDVAEIADIVADAALAAELRCEEGRQFLRIAGARRRRGQPDEPPIALVHAYLNATYRAIRPQLASLPQSIAAMAEKLLGVRVQRIVQELEPVLLDAEAASSLAAPQGGAALLARRWYYVENHEPMLIGRCLYPSGRMVYRTELLRGRLPTSRGED